MFGKLSGYELNISKTQVITFNFSAPNDLSREANSLKYLGIILTKVSKLSQTNYGSLTSKIKSDLHRWNLIPFLNLKLRINAVKMNILPWLLYVFTTLPVEVDDTSLRNGLSGCHVSSGRVRIPNSWKNHTLKVRQKVVETCKIKNMLQIFRWCTYDTEYQLDRHDKQLQSWIKNGLTTFLSFTNKNALQSFQTLQSRHLLDQSDFFRFLQMQTYFNKSCKLSNSTPVETEFKILRLAYNTTVNKAISRMYNVQCSGQKGKHVAH